MRVKNKFGEQHDNELDNEIKMNNILFRVIYLLTVVILLLGIGYLNLKESTTTIIKLPPNSLTSNIDNKKIVYGLNKANVTFYELWGRYIIDDISNFTFENIDKKINLIINEMRPSAAIPKIKETDIFKKSIILNKVKQKFQIIDFKITVSEDASSANLVARGISKQEVSKRKIESKECEYEVSFKFYEGVFYVKDFGTNCFN